jgi:hypothetical protein
MGIVQVTDHILPLCFAGLDLSEKHADRQHFLDLFQVPPRYFKFLEHPLVVFSLLCQLEVNWNRHRPRAENDIVLLTAWIFTRACFKNRFGLSLERVSKIGSASR